MWMDKLQDGNENIKLPPVKNPQLWKKAAPADLNWRACV